MRKFCGVLLVFLISVLLVSACSPAETEATDTVGRTPAVAGGTEAVLVTPPLITEEVTLAATVEATEAVTAAVTQSAPSVTENPAVTHPAAGTPTAAIPETGLGTHPWLVSSWLGGQVYDLNCEPVGQVSGLMVGQGNGQIMYAWVTLDESMVTTPVITETPALGTGTPAATEAPAPPVANMVLIPWAATAAGQTEGTAQTCTSPGLVLTVDQAAVQGSPAFDVAPDTTVAGWDADLQTYWSRLLTGAPGLETPAATETPSATEASSSPEAPEVGDLILIDNVSAWRVVDEGGSNFGPVQDIILDPTTGRITHLIWRPGGFLQVSPQLVPLPITAGVLDPATVHFILNESLTAEQVEQAPGFQSLDEAGNPAESPAWIQNAQDFWGQFSEE